MRESQNFVSVSPSMPTVRRGCAAVRRMGRGAGRWLAVECGVAVVVIVGVLPSTRREPISPSSVTSSINRALVVGRDTLNTTRAVEIVAFTMPMREGPRCANPI